MPIIIKSKKRKTRKLKPKIRIGKDLKKDEIGTNQLLNENEINNIIQSDNIIYNKKIYKQYKQNLNEQKIRQQHGGDPTINIKLKHESHNLYNKMINNIFSGNDEQIQIVKTKQNKTKNNNIKYKSMFEENIDEQVQENIKNKTPQKPKPFGTRQELDSFLVNQSEKQLTRKMLFPPDAKIEEWRNQFSELLKNDEYLDKNFKSFVLDYFDEEQRKNIFDKQKQDVYAKKDVSQRRQRKNVKEAQKIVFSLDLD
jgi:hypothetical protein